MIEIIKALPLAPGTCTWELSRRCNLDCGHGGTSAGAPRDREMPLDRMLGVAGELAALGCQRLSLSGGEPTLSPHWAPICEEATRLGVHVNMVTNGLTADRALVQRAKDVWLRSLGVSLDGLEASHDRMRRRPGLFKRVKRLLDDCATVGMPIGVITTLWKERHFGGVGSTQLRVGGSRARPARVAENALLRRRTAASAKPGGEASASNGAPRATVAGAMSLRPLVLTVLMGCGTTQPPPRLPPAVESVSAPKACTTRLRAERRTTGARRSPFVGPTKPTAAWVHELQGERAFGMATDADANAFVALLDGVVALDRGGRQLWRHTATVQPRTIPALSPDGGLYLQVINDRHDSLNWTRPGRGGVQRLDACGQISWMAHAPPQNGATPTVGPHDLVYFTGHDRTSERPELLEVVRPDGRVAWTHPIADKDTVTTPVVVADDGSVYYGTFQGKVVALNHDGAPRWATPLTTSVILSVIRGDDGTIYATYDGFLAALDASGNRRWEQRLGRGGSPAPAIGADGILYVGGAGLSAFGSDGTRLWRIDLKGPVLSPTIGRDGTLFVGSADHGHGIGRLHAITKNGEVLWTYYLEPPSSMELAADGVLYVTAGRRVYAIGECAQHACEDDGSALPARNGAPREPVATPSNRRSKPAPSEREAHEGFTIYPNCSPGTTAIVSSAGSEFSWMTGNRSSVKAAAMREQFRGEALGAAGPIRSHASGFGLACVEPLAFSIFVVPGEDVLAAARRIGEWLVRAGLRGEVNLVVSAIPEEQ